MAKTYVFINENSTLVIAGKTLKTGDEITLKKAEDIAVADACEYLKEKEDVNTTNA